MNRKSWRDLASAEPKCQEITTDVCIVGAGAAGIYLASELCRRGRRVVVLEAGPRKGINSAEIGFDPSFEAMPYHGATLGRYFGLGGSTIRWGGVLVPHSEYDLRSEATSNDVWFHIIQTVRAQTSAVLRRLGCECDPELTAAPEYLSDDVVAALTEAGLHVQANLQMPFLKKNFVHLLSGLPGEYPQPVVVYNAVAKSWSVESGLSDAAISSVTAVSRAGNEVTVIAGKFVIAAGAIESARILLELDELGRGKASNMGVARSYDLADHLSCRIADVDVKDLDRTAALFAPRFSGAWMRGVRLLERDASKETPRAFAHFIFSNESAGFDLARQVLLAVQARRMPTISIATAVTGASDLGRLAYSRLVRAQLHVPSGTPVHLQLDMEQEVTRRNCIRLSDARDAFGRRKTSIHWRVAENDLADMRKIARRIIEKWPGAQNGLPRLLPCEIDGEKMKPHDAYHPVATCRMGDDPEAIVDRDMRVAGVRNLWVSSTGVLPSAGTANPTFTMLCLTHRLAAHLAATGNGITVRNV